jgi:hypothetical protein
MYQSELISFIPSVRNPNPALTRPRGRLDRRLRAHEAGRRVTLTLTPLTLTLTLTPLTLTLTLLSPAPAAALTAASARTRLAAASP